MTQEEKTQAKKYIKEHLNIVVDFSNLETAWESLMDFLLENIELLGDHAQVQAYFDAKVAEAKQAKIAALESQIAELPILQAKLEAELAEIKK